MSDGVLAAVEAHLVSALGECTGRASVTFLGMEPIEVLRFGPDSSGLTRYVTFGMSRQPLPDPTSPVLELAGPRAELLLSLHGVHDSVLRPLTVLAATPAVEGTRPSPGSSYDVGAPLCDGATVSAVLVGAPGGLVAELELDVGLVSVFPLLPMTAEEAAWKRLHSASELEERWLAAGTDLRDHDRPGVALR